MWIQKTNRIFKNGSARRRVEAGTITVDVHFALNPSPRPAIFSPERFIDLSAGFNYWPAMIFKMEEQTVPIILAGLFLNRF